jgi:heptosyltransferase II
VNLRASAFICVETFLVQPAPTMLPAAAKHVAIIQPLPGIGDMIWHLPHICAIADFVGEPITLVAKTRSNAAELFAGEATVRDVLWLDRNSESRRGKHDGATGLARLVADLRRGSFDAVVVLHHSRMLAIATFAAGIPYRFGYGFGSQRLFLNRPPFLSRPQLSRHPHEQATAWLAAAAIPLGQTEPTLSVTDASRSVVRRRLGDHFGPLVAIGIAASEPFKQWGAARFAELAATLLDSGWPRLVLAGGPAEIELAETIRRLLGERATRVYPALGWKLGELAALLAEAAFYVGNDTGVMNLSAAVGIRTYGLFGAVPPFHHSDRIAQILPPDGRTDIPTGMSRITTQAVLDAIRADRGSIGPQS